MKEKINTLLLSASEEITNATNSKELEDVKIKYLGKSGELTAILKSMKDLPNEEKPVVGALVNEARSKIENQITTKKDDLVKVEIEAKLKAEKVDVTLPTNNENTGSLHPVTNVMYELLDIFKSMGFDVYDGPEVDFYEYNFDKLNIPKDHPARDSQDTFYVNDFLLLRSQTSTMQIRVMENKKPPLKMVSAGRVYRGDELDATHSTVFYQCEALVVDKHVTLSDLNGTLLELAKRLFGENTNIRMRPSFFPFTEPSVEVDVTCVKCQGKGCTSCKGTGWIEILGAGMVNPKVLEHCGIDSKEYSGFAIGAGVERIAMRKYEINDMRTIYENDVRALKQFN